MLWVCSYGHVFEFGSQEWHTDVAQAGTLDGNLVPAYCLDEDDEGNACMDSSSLVPA